MFMARGMETEEGRIMCAKSLQSCPTLGDPMDCSPPGSSVHGILQARILERVACPLPQISDRPEFSSATKWLSFSPKRTTEMCSISDHLVFTGEGERDALFSFHQDIQSRLLMSLD